jgi:plasmid stabilization system protein ParE
MKIRLAQPARDDLLAAYDFYERQAEGLGIYFQDSLIADIDSLYLYAGIHPVYHSFHRMLAARFPYAIYYRIENGAAIIFAILDCRRGSRHTKSRLKQSAE